jgi:hypothetical protein
MRFKAACARPLSSSYRFQLQMPPDLAEVLVGTVFVRNRHAAPCQESRANDGNKNALRDHSIS